MDVSPRAPRGAAPPLPFASACVTELGPADDVKRLLEQAPTGLDAVGDQPRDEEPNPDDDEQERREQRRQMPTGSVRLIPDEKGACEEGADREAEDGTDAEQLDES